MRFNEAEVHSSLLAFLREGNKPNWPHHLTMARLVARTLRHCRPALIQTGTTVSQYCLSYLTPALLSDSPALLVVPSLVREYLLSQEIPPLQNWLRVNKEICSGDRWPGANFRGIMLTSPQAWLDDRLKERGNFPLHIPTIVDRADDLEEWTRQQLTVTIDSEDWEQLRQEYPTEGELIRDARAYLTKTMFDHPANPYECYLLESQEREKLRILGQTLENKRKLNDRWRKFWYGIGTLDRLLWASIARESGQFTLHLTPLEVATALTPVWQKQPVVLIGSFLDSDKKATIYRQQIGLGEMLSLKFSCDRENDRIRLYLPDRIPMPNTPQFQQALMEQIRALVNFSSSVNKLVVLLVGDMPLKARVGALVAAEFGSRVRVEETNLSDSSILVSGWEFWRSHQELLPTPQLLAIATLPIPSLENPLVAGRVAYHKRQRQDWFRLYLLPTALREIQRAVLPLRESQGIVALLDNRVNHRSYGKQILAALEPYERINYLDSLYLI